MGPLPVEGVKVDTGKVDTAKGRLLQTLPPRGWLFRMRGAGEDGERWGDPGGIWLEGLLKGMWSKARVCSQVWRCRANTKAAFSFLQGRAGHGAVSPSSEAGGAKSLPNNYEGSPSSLCHAHSDNTPAACQSSGMEKETQPWPLRAHSLIKNGRNVDKAPTNMKVEDVTEALEACPVLPNSRATVTV